MNDEDMTKTRYDAAHETGALCDAFFRSVIEAARPASTRALAERARSIANEHAHRAVDEASRLNLELGAAVLAAEELLSPMLPDERRISLLCEAFAESGGHWTAKVSAWLDASPDPFRDMVAISKKREETAFGPTFEFERARDDDEAYFVDVRRCFWHDFFGAVGRPELTRVMCAFDRNWYSAIDPARHRLRFERTTTLGFGGDRCPFHFSRTASKRGP